MTTKALPAAPLRSTGPTAPDPRRRSHQTNLNGVQYQYPVCDRCDRDVVAFTWADHFEHDGTTPMRTFFAACHGEIESVTVKQSELHATKGANFKIERAFLRALPPGPEDDAADVPELTRSAVPRLGR